MFQKYRLTDKEVLEDLTAIFKKRENNHTLAKDVLNKYLIAQGLPFNYTEKQFNEFFKQIVNGNKKGFNIYGK